MPRTKTAHKAGTTDYYAVVYFTVRLDDPNACGNMGGEGFDDDSVSQDEFPTEVQAQAWCESQSIVIGERVGHTVIECRVTEHRWTREEFDDPKFGHIIDAIYDEVGERYGYPNEQGVKWDEEVCR